MRLEFADELRTRSLYEIMPRIATLVPQLLQKGDLAAAVNRLTVEDTIKIQVPEKLLKDSHVAISPKRGYECWYQPGIYNVKDGYIELSNITDNPINIPKSSQIGEIRDVVISSKVGKVWENTPDITQFHNPIPPPVEV